MKNFLLLHLLLLTSFFFTQTLNAQISITGDIDVCEFSCTDYQVTGTTGYTACNWQCVGGTVTQNNNNTLTVCWGSSGAGSLTVNKSDASNNTLSQTLTVNITPLPEPEIIYPETCTYTVDTAMLSQVGIPPGSIQGNPCLGGPDEDCIATCDSSKLVYRAVLHPGSTYEWEIVGGTIVGVNTLDSLCVQWGDVGPASIKLIETDSFGCKDSIEICIKFLKSPKASFSANTVCLGQATQFTDLSIDADDWYWNFGNGQTSTLQNPSHVFSMPGTHTVCLIVSKYHYGNWIQLDDPTGGGFEVPCKYLCVCTDTIKMDIIVDPLAGPDIECPSTVCVNDSTCYTTTAMCSNYVWSISGNGIIQSGGAATDTFVCVKWLAGPTGTVTLAVPACTPPFCPTPTTITIPIIDDDNLAITGPNPACAGETATYEVPKYVGAWYEWWAIGGTLNDVSPFKNHVRVTWPNVYNITTGQVVVKVSHPYLSDGDPDPDCMAMDTLDVTIKPKFTVNGPSQTCENETSTFTASHADTFNWTVTGGTIQGASTGSSVMVLWNTGAGNYTVSATAVNPANYCNLTATTTIKILPTPATPNMIDGPALICAGGTYTYKASAAPATGNFIWTATGGTVMPGTGNPVLVSWDAIPPTGGYSLSVFQQQINDPFCESAVYTIPIDYVQSISISGPSPACINTTSTYMVTTVPTLTSPISSEDFTWTINPPTVPVTIGSITSGQGTNTIDIQWHNDIGFATIQVEYCGLTANLIVNIAPPSAPGITGPTDLCENDTGILSEGAACTGHVWKDETGSIISTAATATITGGGCYTLEAICSNCPISETYCVNEWSLPNASIYTTDNLEICTPVLTGNDVTFTALQSPGYTYSWEQDCGSGYAPVSNSSGCPTSTPAHQLCQLNITNACSYRVLVTDANGCTNYSNVISTFLSGCIGGGGTTCLGPMGTVDIIVNSPMCNPVSFTNNSSSASNFVWNLGDGTIHTGPTPPPHTYANAGVYTVCLTGDVPAASPPTCTLIDCVTVEVPVVADFDYTITCNGVQFYDRSSTTNTITQWNWNFSGSFPSSSTAQNPLHSFCCFSGGSYTADLTVSAVNSITGDICTDTYQVTIPDYLLNIAAAYPTQACVGDKLAFTDNSTGQAVSWIWDFGDGATSALQNPCHTYTQAGTYFIQLGATNQYGCTNGVGFAMPITIYPLPTVNLTTTPAPPDVCQGDPVLLTATAGYVNYDWYDTSTGLLLANTTSNTYNVYQSGVYEVVVTDANGCKETSNSVTAVVHQNPPAIIDGPTDICIGDDLVLSAPPGYSYLWSNSATWATIYETGLAIGSYTYSVTITDNTSPVVPPCETIVSILVTVHPNPTTPIIVTNPSPPDPLCEGDLITLTVSNAVAGDIYLWSTGQSGTSIMVTQSGKYSVTAISPYGCTSVAEIDVCPLPDICLVPSGCYTRCNPDTICVPDVFGSYQWLYNNTPIINATDTCFIATQDGEYRVILENDWGCTDTSDVLKLKLIDCPCGSCDSLDVVLTELTTMTMDSCCYEVDITNNYCNPIVGFGAEVTTPGWQFNTANLSTSHSWHGTPLPKEVRINHNAGLYPTGTTNSLLTFCLISNTSPVPPPPQDIKFTWYELIGNDSIPICDTTMQTFCTDSIPSDPPCAEIINTNVECDPADNGLYKFTFQITNLNATQTATNILLNNPTGFSFRTTPTGPDLSSYVAPVSIPPLGTSGVICIYIYSPTPITTPTNVYFNYGIWGNGFCCHPPAPYCITLDPCYCLTTANFDLKCIADSSKYRLTFDVTNLSTISTSPITGLVITVKNPSTSGITLPPTGGFYDWTSNPLPYNSTRTISTCVDPFPITDPDLILGYVIHHGPLPWAADSCCTNIPCDTIPIPPCCEDIDVSNSLMTQYRTAVTCGVTNDFLPASSRYTFGIIDHDAVLPVSSRIDYTGNALVSDFHHPDWHVDEIGNVFGIAIDNFGYMYVGASANYSAGFLGSVAIIKYGNIGGGANDLGAAGTIYQMDRITGQPQVFAQLPQNMTTINHQDCEGSASLVRNTGPGLGNLVYDKEHDQLFVANWEDGRIYRLDMSGNIIDTYDPAIIDNNLAGLPPTTDLIPYGLAVNNDGTKLFFGTLYNGPIIFSIDLNTNGSFVGTINNTSGNSSLSIDNYVGSQTFHHNFMLTDRSVSDLEFLPNGDLVAGLRVGCNGNFATSYNHGGTSYIISEVGGLYNSPTQMPVSHDANLPFNFLDGDDQYGGVAFMEFAGGTYEHVVSSADILLEPGPHGIAIFDQSFSGNPINQLAAIAYAPITVNTDLKGIGGDVQVFNPCIPLPKPTPSDSCCVSYDDFCDRFDLGFNVDASTCNTLKIDAIGLGPCDFYAIDWGDGTTTGPFPGNSSTISHTYTNDGFYSVCIIASELDAAGNICWDKQYCNEYFIEPCPVIIVKAKLFLEAAYDAETGEMTTYLHQNNLLPLEHPFSRAPWLYSEPIAVNSYTDIPSNAVDWVLVELRNATDYHIIEAIKPAFLLSNGCVVDVDEPNDGISFTNLTNNTDYYVLVRSRNHLATMSATPINVAVGSPVEYDFTTGVNQAFGPDQQMELATGVAAQFAGDFDSNGVVTVLDYNLYLNEGAGVNIYSDGDLNMDGNLTIQDFNNYFPNASVQGINVVRY